MKIWLRRVFALALISSGIAMILLPFNNSRSGSTEQEIVSLQKIELLNLDEINVQFPEIEITDITGPELNPDDYPDLFRAFINLGEDWISESGDLMEWSGFQNTLFNEKKEFRLIVFRDALIACSTIKVEEIQKVQFSYLGRYNTQIKTLSETDLKKYKTIIKAIEDVNFGKESFSELTPIPITEWNKMVDRYLNPMEDSQTFKFDGIYYGPKFRWDVIYMSGEVKNLQAVLKIIGVLFLFIGFLVAKKLYQQKKEFQQNSRKKTILFDLISLVFIIPAAYMIVNTVLKMALFIPPYIEDDFLIIIGNFFFCVGTPMLALLTSRLTQPSV